VRYVGNDEEITKRKHACMEKKNYRSERPFFDARCFSHLNENIARAGEYSSPGNMAFMRARIETNFHVRRCMRVRAV